MLGYERNLYRSSYFLCMHSSKSCYSIWHHMASCQYRGQRVRRTDGRAAKCQQEESLQTEDGNHGTEVDVRGEKVRAVERARNVEREPSTEKDVSAFCLSSTETALELLNKRARKKVANIIQLVFGTYSDAREL